MKKVSKASAAQPSTQDALTWEPCVSFLILRIFLGLVALMNGLTKFGGPDGYAENMRKMALAITEESFIPLPMSQMFAMPLGYILILLGLAILSGFFMRVALAASGLLYVALSFGLLASKNSPGVAWLGIYIGLTVMALHLAQHNRFQINRL